MNIIFLDFNGVLDTYDNMDIINKDNLNRLKRITEVTSSKVVISSSLKNSYFYTGHFSKNLKNIIEEIRSVGIEVIGITPKANTREEEIELYLQQHPEIDNFCILDDDYEMEKLKDNLVKLPSQMTEGQTGLNETHVERAINILNGFNKKLRKQQHKGKV